MSVQQCLTGEDAHDAVNNGGVVRVDASHELVKEGGPLLGPVEARNDRDGVGLGRGGCW